MILYKTHSMKILISCAKIMNSDLTIKIPFTSTPEYQSNAFQIASILSQYSTDELQTMLKVNPQIAFENKLRYEIFNTRVAPKIPAIFTYSGIVFKYINPSDFTYKDFKFAQKHLNITSFIYGLLKPMDLINSYRLEGNIKLQVLGDVSMFNYWKTKLTDNFIKEIKEDGGILCNLASNEMKKLFEWKRVMEEVQVISPSFKVYKDGQLKTIVVYTKMMRGEVAREIIKKRITKLKELEILLENYAVVK